MNQEPSRIHSLASCYENAFTTMVRLDSLPREALPGVQVFRDNIKAALRGSLEKGKTLGYSSEG